MGKQDGAVVAIALLGIRLPALEAWPQHYPLWNFSKPWFFISKTRDCIICLTQCMWGLNEWILNTVFAHNKFSRKLRIQTSEIILDFAEKWSNLMENGAFLTGLERIKGRTITSSPQPAPGLLPGTYDWERGPQQKKEFPFYGRNLGKRLWTALTFINSFSFLCWEK